MFFFFFPFFLFFFFSNHSIPYLWLQKSKSFFLPSTISSKKSSSCPIIFSAPDLNTPKHPLKFSTLSPIPTSDSQSSTPCEHLLSNSPLSSSMATFDLLNSYSRIPGRPLIWLISAATLCCNLAVDIMKADPNSKQPSYPPLRKLDSGQQ